VKDGRTRIRYTELIAQRGQARWGFGVLAGFGGMGAGAFGAVAGVAIAKGAEVSAAQGAPVVLGLAAVLGLATAIGSYLGLSRSLARRAQTRAAFAAEVLARVESAAHANLLARTRVEASPSERTTETENEVEDEAAELERQRL
jgi:hypothetical protein